MDFETMYPKIDEHLKTEAGRAALMGELLAALNEANPGVVKWIERNLPNPYNPPVSPNSNPSSINQ